MAQGQSGWPAGGKTLVFKLCFTKLGDYNVAEGQILI